MAVLEFPRTRAQHLAPSFFQRLARLWEHRRERAELLSLSERELKDIGINRYDAVMEANRPFWEG